MDHLIGAIDLHVHASPDVRPRFADAVACAEMARAAGMAGFALKNHHYSTAPLVPLLRRIVPEISVFGYLVLNRPVGGINPAAVEAAIALGVHIVSFPTFDSDHHLRTAGKDPADGLHLSRGGELLPEVKAVIDLVVAADRVVATGHSAPEDSLRILRYTAARGGRQMLVTHASSSRIDMTIAQQREAASLGAFIEHSLVATHEVMEEPIEFGVIVEQIRAVGPAHCVISTDYGQTPTGSFVDGMARFATLLRNAGIADADIHAMAARQPAALVGAESGGPADRKQEDRCRLPA